MDKYEKFFSDNISKDCLVFYQAPNKRLEQPVDFIVINKVNGLSSLIDVKGTQSGRFDFSRIEPNQRQLFEHLDHINFIGFYGFAIVYNNTITRISYKLVKELERQGIKSYNVKQVLPKKGY